MKRKDICLRTIENVDILCNTTRNELIQRKKKGMVAHHGWYTIV